MTRPAAMARARAWRAAMIAACLIAVAGCQRKAQFMPERAGTDDVVADSLLARVRDIQRAWESGPPDDSLATRTAEVLRDALDARGSAEWPRRAQRLLDSLGVGAELASGECALVVNLFSRGDLGGESWPYLYWCAKDGPRVQPIEGKNLRLSHVVARGVDDASGGRGAKGGAAAKGAGPGVAALFQRRSAAGFQPMLMVWSADSALAKWRMAQTLGPDSLGGVGTGEFSGADTTVDLTLRTYEATALFDECPTCPHVYRTHRFRWGLDGFRRTEETLVPSPYSTFVQFIQALVRGDSRAADERTTDPALTDEARSLGWSSRGGKWRVAPGVEESPERMVFYRGDTDAYAVHFARRGNDWVVAGFEPTTRTMVE
jgi:hypothetical protein